MIARCVVDSDRFHDLEGVFLLMELTRASSYAFHALAYMAQQKGNDPIPSHRIAKERGIPERFLLKVLKPLVDARVLESVKGPSGGYRLARALSDVTFLEVVEAVENRKIQGKAPTPEKNKKFNNYDPSISMSVHKKLEKVCESSADLVRKHLEQVKVSEIIRR
jgi:Rrf2 family protein